MVARKHKSHKKGNKNNFVKWSIIAGAVILVALLAVFMWPEKSSENSSNQNQTLVIEAPKYLASDCSILNTDDIKSVFDTPEVTQEKDNVQETTCSKSWKIWKVEGTSRSPLDAVTVIVTETTKLANYNYQNPSATLERVCARFSSTNLGDYKSCNLFGEIYFGKGNYLVQLQCVGCPEGNGESLAKTVLERM